MLTKRDPNTYRLLVRQSHHSGDVIYGLTGKRFVKVDPAGSSAFSMGPCMKPFSTSFKVASKRLMSNSLSPELCTDSRKKVRDPSQIFTGHAGLNFWEKTKPLFESSTKVKSSCPASRMSKSRRQSLLSSRTRALLTCSVRSLAT